LAHVLRGNRRAFGCQHGSQRLALQRLLRDTLDYLLERLRSELGDDIRVGQAIAHAKMIRERIATLKNDSENRKLNSETISYLVQVAMDGLDLIEEMIGDHDTSSKKQNQIDIVCDGFNKNISDLRRHLIDLDKKLNSQLK
jgi:hypothetical protein